MYQFIIQDTLKGLLVGFSLDKLLVLGVFALGCLAGVMTMSRLLSWTFKRYRSLTLAILTASWSARSTRSIGGATPMTG